MFQSQEESRVKYQICWNKSAIDVLDLAWHLFYLKKHIELKAFFKQLLPGQCPWTSMGHLTYAARHPSCILASFISPTLLKTQSSNEKTDPDPDPDGHFFYEFIFN